MADGKDIKWLKTLRNWVLMVSNLIVSVNALKCFSSWARYAFEKIMQYFIFKIDSSQEGNEELFFKIFISTKSVAL